MKEFVPGLARWRRHRGQAVLQMCLIALAFSVTEGAWLLGDSMEATAEKRRIDNYGKWQFACLDPEEETVQTLRENPFLTEQGEVRTSVWHETADGAQIYLGCADEAAAELLGLSLKEGRMPERGGEAAVEESVLAELGAAAEVGESFTFTYQRGEDGAWESMDLTLCGVLADYSLTSCLGRKTQLPSVLTAEEGLPDTGADAADGSICLLYSEGKWSRLKDMESDLLGMNRDGEWIANEYTYPEELGIDMNGETQLLNLLRRSALLLCLVILLIAISVSVNARSREWSVLALLGAEKRQIFGILMRECVLFVLIGMAAGMSAAFLVFASLCLLLAKHLSAGFVPAVSARHALMSVGLGSAIAAASYLWAGRRAISDGMRNRTGNQRRRSRGRTAKPRRRGRRELTWSRIFFARFGRHRFYMAASSILMAAILALPCLGIRQVAGDIQTLRIDRKYSGLYELDGMDESETRGLNKKYLKQLERIPGIESVYARQITLESEFFTMDFSELPEDEYERLRRNVSMEDLEWEEEQIEEEYNSGGSGTGSEYVEAMETLEKKRQMISDGQIDVSLITLPDEESLEVYRSFFASGQIDSEAFFAGEEVIYLASPLTEEDGSYYAAVWEEFWEEGETIFTQEAMQPGFSGSVSYQGQTEEVTVGAVIDSFPIVNRYTSLPQNLTVSDTILFCSEAFLARFNGWQAAENVQMVFLEAGSEAGYATDQLVMQVFRNAEGMELTNYRDEIETEEENLILDAAFYGTIGGLGVLLLALILRGLARVQEKHFAETDRTLRALGMRRGQRRMLSLCQTAVPAAIGIVTATLGLSTFHYFALLADYRKKNFLFTPELSSFSPGIDAPLYLTICMIYFAGMLILAGPPEGKERKQ